MHEYYIKIKKCNIEFEFSTNDKVMFEKQLLDLVNSVMEQKTEPSTQEITLEKTQEQETIEEKYQKEEENITQEYVQEVQEAQEQKMDNYKRSGFLDVKTLTSINEITTPTFDFSDTKDESIEDINFEQMLEASIENPKTEVSEKKEIIYDFQEYLQSYSPQNNIDKLIITALYILNVENKERFTIKQINAKLVPATEQPINHGTIEDALIQNLIKIVPDLTNTNEFTEYTLTDEGEHYFIE